MSRTTSSSFLPLQMLIYAFTYNHFAVKWGYVKWGDSCIFILWQHVSFNTPGIAYGGLNEYFAGQEEGV